MLKQVFFALFLIGIFSGSIFSKNANRNAEVSYSPEENSRPWDEIARAFEQGTQFMEAGQLDSALHYFLVAEEALDRILMTAPDEKDKIAEWQVDIYDQLSRVYQNQEMLGKAVQYANLSLDITTLRYGNNHPATCRNYRHLGDLYLAAGEFLRSEDYYRKAIFVLEQARDHDALTPENSELLGEFYASLAKVYYVTSRPLREENALYEKSLTLVKKENKKAAVKIRQLLKMGSVQIWERDLDSARKEFSRADSIWQKHQAVYAEDKDFQLLQAEIIRVLGYYWKAQGQYEKVLSHYKKYVQITERLGAPITQSRAVLVLMEIGEIYGQRLTISRSSADSSVYYTQKALHKICRTFASHDITQLPESEDVKSFLYTYGILKQLARYHEKRAFQYGNESDKISALKAGLSLLDLADKLHTRHLEEATVLRGGRISGLIHGSILSHDAGLRFAHLLYQLEPADSLLEKAFYYIQRLKGQKLWLARLKEEAYSIETLPDSILAKERELLANVHYYENQLHLAQQAKNVSSIEAYLNDSLFHAKRAHEKLLCKMDEEYPMYWKLQSRFKPVTVQEIRQELRADEILVEYSGDPSSIDAFIITKDQAPQLQWLVYMNSTTVKKVFATTDSLNQLLQNSIMQRKSSREKFVTWSHQLYQYFLQPLEKQLAGKKRLIVIGDGPTNFIPFETLLSTGEAQPFDRLNYLIRSHEISYHYSSTLFAESRRKSTVHHSGIYAFAPVYDEQDIALAPSSIQQYGAHAPLRAFDEDGNYAPLPESEREATSIVQLFEERAGADNTLVLRREASESSLKAALEKPYRFVHIAGHSFADLENPDFSGIACAKGEETREDEILQAGEISQLRIKADLVTLSSCESGYGKAVDNDGLQGLNRAFVYAGAPNVAFSLWKVYDKVSASLMVDFYAHILQGQSYSAGLRAAKLRLLADPATASPHFWGAYMLIGG
jgi:CHAT domain-containing protein